ncbi:MAG: hypothetical protein HW410_1363 [Nitrosarchaeum sp.]|nr:hypothetical protein [Nitrosarchaeum sp.]
MTLQQQKPMHFINYKTVSLILKSRDLFYPPKYILDEVGIKPGVCVLDYGCGPGSYSIAVAELLAGTGKVFALDIHPLAVNQVSQIAKMKKLTNIKTILSNCDTGLPSNSVDIILLYYLFNDLENSEKVLCELYRVIKPHGILSLSEFNLNKISPRLEMTQLFRLVKKNKATHTFMKTS